MRPIPCHNNFRQILSESYICLYTFSWINIGRDIPFYRSLHIFFWSVHFFYFTIYHNSSVVQNKFHTKSKKQLKEKLLYFRNVANS